RDPEAESDGRHHVEREDRQVNEVERDVVVHSAATGASSVARGGWQGKTPARECLMGSARALACSRRRPRRRHERGKTFDAGKRLARRVRREGASNNTRGACAPPAFYGVK